MKKDVLLTVVGKHKADGSDWDSVEIRTTGTLMEKDSDLYLFYDEVLGEGERDVSHNRVKIEQDPLMITITKSGAITSVMSFAENREEKSSYETPFGSLQLGVTTRAIRFESKDESLNLKIRYDLAVNFEPMYESEISIQADPLRF